jgi:mRNA interferase MazF
MTLIKRGELYAASELGLLTRKPRPVLVIQNDRANVSHITVNICLLSPILTGLNQFRVAIAPNADNGLDNHSEVQVDRNFSYRVESLQSKIGSLSKHDMLAVDAALRRWLDL